MLVPIATLCCHATIKTHFNRTIARGEGINHPCISSERPTAPQCADNKNSHHLCLGNYPKLLQSNDDSSSLAKDDSIASYFDWLKVSVLVLRVVRNLCVGSPEVQTDLVERGVVEPIASVSPSYQTHTHTKWFVILILFPGM